MADGKIGRRAFLQAGTSGVVAMTMAQNSMDMVRGVTAAKPALLGGDPVRKGPFPGWPQIDERYGKMWEEVLEKRNWCRLNGDCVKRFEDEYAKAIGS